MANTFITPDLVAAEGLNILRNRCVMKDLVHTDYAKEFVNAIGDTVNVRVPASLTAADFTTAISAQNVTESYVGVKLRYFKDVSVTLTSKDNTLELKDFTKQIVEPAMAALAEQIDADIANFIFENASTSVSRSATSPNTLTNIAALGKALDKAKAPQSDRSLVFSPDHKYAYALTDNLSKAAYAGDNQALRDANLGRLYSMETYMDQNTPASTATTSGTAVGTMKITGIVGANTVAVTELDTNAVTLAAGDGFIYDGKLYRASAGDTATLKAIAALAITPNFAGLNTSGTAANVNTAVTVQVLRNSTSLAFHRDAIAFVNRPMAVPQGAVKAAVASADGLSVRVVWGYDMSSKSDTISFDILYGLAALRAALAVRLVDGTLS